MGPTGAGEGQGQRLCGREFEQRPDVPWKRVHSLRSSNFVPVSVDTPPRFLGDLAQLRTKGHDSVPNHVPNQSLDIECGSYSPTWWLELG